MIINPLLNVWKIRDLLKIRMPTVVFHYGTNLKGAILNDFDEKIRKNLNDGQGLSINATSEYLRKSSRNVDFEIKKNK